MKDNREDFLQKLNAKKKEFEQALQCLINKQREYQENLDGETSMDESDQAQREISVSSNYSLIERKARELKKIDLLIRQVLADAHFGICEECGNPIPPERLLIVPEATLCVPCQRELEKMDHFKKFARQNSLRLSMQPLHEPEDKNEQGILDEDLMGTDLEIIPIVDLEEVRDTELSKDT